MRIGNRSSNRFEASTVQSSGITTPPQASSVPLQKKIDARRRIRVSCYIYWLIPRAQYPSNRITENALCIRRTTETCSCNENLCPNMSKLSPLKVFIEWNYALVISPISLWKWPFTCCWRVASLEIVKMSLLHKTCAGLLCKHDIRKLPNDEAIPLELIHKRWHC